MVKEIYWYIQNNIVLYSNVVPSRDEHCEGKAAIFKHFIQNWKYTTTSSSYNAHIFIGLYS